MTPLYNMHKARHTLQQIKKFSWHSWVTGNCKTIHNAMENVKIGIED